jgi:TatD DNase family protein
MLIPAAGRPFIIAEPTTRMQPTRLIDIGINLAHDSYDPDRRDVVLRALAAGVRRMVVTGSTLESAARAIALCRQWPGLMRATAGIHPHHAQEFPDSDLPKLRELLEDPMATSAGECGLDYFRNFSPATEQRRAFAAQLGLAADLGKPVFLHQRDAHRDFMAILSEHLQRLPRAVVHCFTGSAAELDDYLANDLHVGITGWICDERRGLAVKALVPRIPLNRLMVETDGPYLLPRNIRPKPAHRRNEPMYLRNVFDAICEVRSEDPTAIAAATSANAMAFFGLPPWEPADGSGRGG